MLYMPLSKFIDSNEAVTAAGFYPTEEGIALARDKNNQAAGVRTATGDWDTEIFAGFSLMGTVGAAVNEDTATKVESFLVPEGGSVSLQFPPLLAEVGVRNVTKSEAVEDAVVSGNQVTGLPAGDTVTITYRYQLSWVQMQAMQGHANPGGYAGNQVWQVGVAKRGLLYTSCFDTTVDWATTEYVTVAANGHLTAGDADSNINARILALPNTDIPYLGIEFDAL